MSLLTPSKIEQKSIFSKILSWDIDWVILLTTQRFAVIMTNRPVNPWHVLIVSKEQVADRSYLDDDASSELGRLETFISWLLKSVYEQGMSDKNLLKVCSDGKGFEIDTHLHIHYYPTTRGRYLTEYSADTKTEASLEERALEAERILEYITQNLSSRVQELNITLSQSYKKYKQ